MSVKITGRTSIPYKNKQTFNLYQMQNNLFRQYMLTRCWNV